jgi:UDP:flavonoid glycosyltransferase YjiC (YdhE family)
MEVKVMRIDRINEIERKYSERTQPVTNNRVEGVKDNYRQFQEHLHREMTEEEKQKKNKNKKKKSLLFYPDTLIRDDIDYSKTMYTDLAKNSKKHVVKKDTFELFAERNSKVKKESKVKPRYFK